MATILYRNAVCVFDSADISASLNELGVEFSAEILDETCFGDDTRIHKAGLLMAKMAGKGFAEFGDNLIEPVLFNDNGLDDVVVVVFPNGVVEGATVGDGIGYAMKGVASEYQIGGGVGALLPISFSFEGRGVD
jgi:hypothetical protein